MPRNGPVARNERNILGPMTGAAHHPLSAKARVAAHHGWHVRTHVIALCRLVAHRMAVQATGMFDHLQHLFEQRDRAFGFIRDTVKRSDRLQVFGRNRAGP